MDSKTKTIVYDLSPKEAGDFIGLIALQQSYMHCMALARDGDEREVWRSKWVESSVIQTSKIEEVWVRNRKAEDVVGTTAFPPPQVMVSVLTNQLMVTFATVDVEKVDDDDR